MALTKHKGKPKIPGSGRQKGTPNKKTLAVKEQLEELGIDPLLIAARIMTGEEKGNPHPWLKTFNYWIQTYKGVMHTIYDRVAALPKSRETDLILKDVGLALDKVQKFHDRAKKELAEGHIPIELRARIATQLLEFIYPKRKHIDVTDNRESGLASDLSDEELAMIILEDLEKAKGEGAKH